jgi:spore coat protein U-like protein
MHRPGKIICVLLTLIGLTGPSFAGSTTIAVSATILSKNNCKFNTNSASLIFGDLNPVATAAPDVTREVTINFTCNGKDDVATYVITDDDGQNESGINNNRMQHSTNAAAYLPYIFSVSPETGNIGKGDKTGLLTVTGTVLANNYRSAYAGDYTDVIVISITP